MGKRNYCPSIETCDENNADLVNRVIFVDEKFGNDETGTVEDANAPVKTLKRAFQLLKQNRRSPAERWNVIVRPGNYKIKRAVPNNVTLTGFGLSTVLVGKLTIRGNAEFAAFKLLGATIPCIELDIKNTIPNANVLFSTVDVSLSPYINQLSTSGIMTPVKLNSNSLGSVVVFKDCRFVFDYSSLSSNAESQIFRVSNIRLDLFSCFVRVIVSLSIKNTIVENVSGIVDAELGTYIYESSSSVFTTQTIYFSSSSPGLVLTKDIRMVFNSSSSTPITSQSSSTFPPGLYFYVGTANSQIQSINAVSLISDKIQQRDRILAFAGSAQTKINVQSFQSLIGGPGDIRGISINPNPRLNVTYTAAALGNSGISGAPADPPRVITANDPQPVIVIRDDGKIVIEADVPDSNSTVQFPDPLSINFGAIDDGWTVTVDIKNNATNFVIPGYLLFNQPGGTTLEATLDRTFGIWQVKTYNVNFIPRI